MDKTSIITQPKTKFLINKWDKRIKMVESVQGKPLSLEKKAALASTLENTQQMIRLTEATQSTDIAA